MKFEHTQVFNLENVKKVMDMRYENEIYGLICDLKEYAKEAIKNNYTDTIINYDLKRIIDRVVDDIIDKEAEYRRDEWREEAGYWREEWEEEEEEDCCEKKNVDGVKNAELLLEKLKHTLVER